MRGFILLLIAILIITLGCTSEQAQKIDRLQQENEALKAIIAPPPSSLDALFPPKAEQPIYLFKMLEIGTPFSGIIVDLFENDPQNAMANFERFKAKYVEVSKMVPEWEKDFPIAPVEELGAAMETGDQATVMAALEKVGKVCGDCHAANMLKVQQKYHWGDFKAIRVEDPVTKEEVDFSRLMQYFDGNFVGISVDVEQGQRENAQKQFQGFNARFQALKETCLNCHDTERKYYVDESIQALVNKMGRALKKSPIDPKELEALGQGIGMESCFKCHLVHVPAAFTQLRWAKGEMKEKK